MGHVTPGYEIAVVDKETGDARAERGRDRRTLAPGTRGIQLFLEYFDNPEANAKSFEDGWFKTGDMVKMGPGGNVFYQERDKDLLKVGGENVSAKEVEEVVMTVPGRGSGGRGRQTLTTGSTRSVVAFVIKAANAGDEPELERQIVEACTGKLADFKVPRAVYFVDAFPTGTLDKILKNKLVARWLTNEPPVLMAFWTELCSSTAGCTPLPAGRRYCPLLDLTGPRRSTFQAGDRWPADLLEGGLEPLCRGGPRRGRRRRLRPLRPGWALPRRYHHHRDGLSPPGTDLPSRRLYRCAGTGTRIERARS